MTMTMPALARLRENFPSCESGSCSRRTNPWRALSGKRQGVMFQGRYFCGPECFEKAAADLYRQLLPAQTRRSAKRHRVPLGLVMFSMGLVSQDHLKAALQAQREFGGRVGHWLRQSGAVTELQITSALAMQWSCPVFPIDSHRRFLDCAKLIPLPILEAARMVPVHHLPAGNMLHVAFAETIDSTALYGVEQMLDCRTEPCLAQETPLELALDALRKQERPAEVIFDSVIDPAEMAATARSYALQMVAEEIKIVSCGEYIWTRIDAHGQTTNLLFQLTNTHQSPEIRM